MTPIYRPGDSFDGLIRQIKEYPKPHDKLCIITNLNKIVDMTHDEYYEEHRETVWLAVVELKKHVLAKGVKQHLIICGTDVDLFDGAKFPEDYRKSQEDILWMLRYFGLNAGTGMEKMYGAFGQFRGKLDNNWHIQGTYRDEAEAWCKEVLVKTSTTTSSPHSVLVCTSGDTTEEADARQHQMWQSLGWMPIIVKGIGAGCRGAQSWHGSFMPQIRRFMPQNDVECLVVLTAVDERCSRSDFSTPQQMYDHIFESGVTKFQVAAKCFCGDKKFWEKVDKRFQESNANELADDIFHSMFPHSPAAPQDSWQHWQQSWWWDSWPAQHDQPDPSPPPPPTTPPSTTHGDNLHVRATAIDDLYMSLMQQSNVQQGKVEIQKTDCPRCQHRCFRKYRYDTQEAAGQAAWSHAKMCAMVLEGYHDV